MMNLVPICYSSGAGAARRTGSPERVRHFEGCAVLAPLASPACRPPEVAAADHICRGGYHDASIHRQYHPDMPNTSQRVCDSGGSAQAPSVAAC